MSLCQAARRDAYLSGPERDASTWTRACSTRPGSSSSTSTTPGIRSTRSSTRRSTTTVTVLDLIFNTGAERRSLHEELHREGSRVSEPILDRRRALLQRPLRRARRDRTGRRLELRRSRRSFASTSCSSVADGETGRSALNDYGCGYGALVAVPSSRQRLDVALPRLRCLRRDARARPPRARESAARPLRRQRATSSSRRTTPSRAGSSTCKLDVTDEDWREYVAAHARQARELSTSRVRLQHADELLRRRTRCDADLYYGDPRFFFDHCKRRVLAPRRAAARLRLCTSSR